MKVKMLEHYQDAQVVLQPDQVAEVDFTLGTWLVQHRKAYQFVEGTIESIESFVEFKPLPELTEENVSEEKVSEPVVVNTQDAPKRGKRSK